MQKVAAEECVALGGDAPTLESYPSREVELGPLKIWRALPVRGKRLIGPWCFLDRYGPLSFTDEKAMDVAAHPHIGLQTVSWLLEGEVLHRDSLGFEALVRAGGVNVMTAGAGIAHAEETPKPSSGRLSGVQLWIAMRDAERHAPASFHHVPQVPVVDLQGGNVQVFAGSMSAEADLIGGDVTVGPRSTIELPLESAREHGVFVLDGEVDLEHQRLDKNTLYYLGTGRSSIYLSSGIGARVLLIGGPPFPETILMWWNFVARMPEEIVKAREEWEHGNGFGVVAHYKGERLRAPSLMKLARPNPAS